MNTTIQDGNAAAFVLRHGKDILVFVGSPREPVDSFRSYGKDGISIEQTTVLITALRDAGARVTVVTPFSSGIDVSGVEIISVRPDDKKIVSTHDMLVAGLSRAEMIDWTMVRHEDLGRANAFGFFLQLANIPAITCPAPVGHKIKKTGSEQGLLFEVVGNVDIIETLEDKFWPGCAAGFDKFGHWVGCNLLEPLACPDAPEDISRHIKDLKTLRRHAAAVRVIVTTARTEEAVTTTGDFITNFFSGRQGQEIARAFAETGAEVTLISGPTHLPDVDNPLVHTVRVRSAREMAIAATRELARGYDVFVGAAAVADFEAECLADVRGIGKDQSCKLSLSETPSIVAIAAHHPCRPDIVVSFAAQSPETIEAYALEKFRKLGVDMTVANPIGQTTIAARDPSRNQVMLIDETGIRRLPEMEKHEVADILVREVMEKRRALRRRTAAAHQKFGG